MIDKMKFLDKYENSDYESLDYTFDFYDARDLVMTELLYRYEKILDKIQKKIAKQIKKNPFITFYKVSEDLYSDNELEAIKLFFKLNNYKICEIDPSKIQTISYTYSSSISTEVIQVKNNKTFWISWDPK